jgi:hypothetical protein
MLRALSRRHLNPGNAVPSARQTICSGYQPLLEAVGFAEAAHAVDPRQCARLAFLEIQGVAEA